MSNVRKIRLLFIMFVVVLSCTGCTVRGKKIVWKSTSEQEVNTKEVQISEKKIKLEEASEYTKGVLEEKYGLQIIIEELKQNSGSMLTSNNEDYEGYAYLKDEPDKRFMITVYPSGEVYDNYAGCVFEEELSEVVGQVLIDWDYECSITYGQVEENLTSISLQDFLEMDNVNIYIKLKVGNHTAENTLKACLDIQDLLVDTCQGDVRVSIETENDYESYNLSKYTPTLEDIMNGLDID